jgi:hypothetical protein
MKWIKITDRLPNQDQQILCTNDKHEFYTAFYTRNPANYEPWYFDHWDSGHCCGREPIAPTHWMPLPEKPQEDNEYDEILEKAIKEGNKRIIGNSWKPVPEKPE